MHNHYPPRETLRQRLERDTSAIRELLADPAIAALVLERLPNGEHAWLRPKADRGESDDALYTVTDQGRRALAMEALFGQPWPTVADLPNCRPREHWGVA